ncbi:DUF447 domain-containing protein [Natronorubrum tibetense]|uniref:DUF447 family protein n=1 Tax=Natronorubrum tibetense GA33 TaxID=1114856 RepID=L9WA35_9EURY|nr:DUF447 domain-containing protein [Natronorubrum tibetense]ELY46121.1 hypothetical protein C496_01101 [Natronorubrum tibetense GA33]
MSGDELSPNGDLDADPTAEWPVSLSGVTESVVATLGPNGLWNLAALGLFAADSGDDSITARTWGNTRTRRNFHRQSEGYVLFVDDPVVFADAALSIVEREEPVLKSAHAWARVSVERIDSGTDDGTDWEQWALRPVESAVETETVPTIDRGFAAVVEATVAASRLDVAGYDEDELRERLAYFAAVVDRAGSPREREALERVREHSAW